MREGGDRRDQASDTQLPDRSIRELQERCFELARAARQRRATKAVDHQALRAGESWQTEPE